MSAESPGDGFAPGSILAGKYRIDRVLGRGGMAQVLAATHLHLGEPLAIKVLHRQVLARAGSFDRFVREARVAMRLRSEHVARVFDIDTSDDGTPFIVMELLRGADFATRLLDDGPFTPSDAIDYVMQACEALAEAHAAGVVHRDLKPANLFLCEGVDGRPLVKVLDFGVSKLLDASPPDLLAATAPATASDEDVAPRSDRPDASGASAPASITVTRAFLGSPHYMAPEQIRSARDVDARADVWALGVIAYELVSGARPFAGETLDALARDIKGREPAPLRDLRELDAALRGALAKDPATRYASVRAFADAVVPFASSEGRASYERVVRVAASAGRGSLAPRPHEEARSLSSPSGGRAVSGPGARTFTAGGIAGVVVGVAVVAALAFMLRARAPSSPPPANAPSRAQECATNGACAASHGGAPFACRASDHTCVPVASEDCTPLFEARDLSADDTVWIGAMFPTTGPYAEAFGTMNRNGVDLARREIDDATRSLAGAQRVPPIALVACDDSEHATRAARHLVDDVGVPAIVGFRSGQEVVDLADSLLVPRGVVAVASLTTSPLITRLPQPPGPRLVWRTTFSLDAVADAAAIVIHDVLEPRARAKAKTTAATRVALARVDMASGLSFAERFYARLAFNGKPAVDNGHDYAELTFPQAATDDDVARVADSIARLRATIVVLSGGDGDMRRIVGAIEERWPASVPRPTYLVADDSTELFADWLGSNADRRHRLFAIVSLSNSPENARFVIRYNQSHPDVVTRTINPGVSYDAVYLLAYAAFAQRTPPFTGTSLASAIARLVGPGPRIATGPTQLLEAVSALASGRTIDLQGTASALDFDLATGEAPSDFALLCHRVDAEGRAAGEDVESGIVYRATTQRIDGTMRCP